MNLKVPFYHIRHSRTEGGTWLIMMYGSTQIESFIFASLPQILDTGDKKKGDLEQLLKQYAYD